MKTLKGVSIGDQFIDTAHRKTKRISTVTDFIERRSMTTGEIIGHECWASHEFMGQVMKNNVCFTTVLRNRVTETEKERTI